MCWSIDVHLHALAKGLSDYFENKKKILNKKFNSLELNLKIFFLNLTIQDLGIFLISKFDARINPFLFEWFRYY